MQAGKDEEERKKERRQGEKEEEAPPAFSSSSSHHPSIAPAMDPPQPPPPFPSSALSSIAKALLPEQSLISHQLRSFDHFMRLGIKTLLLQEFQVIDVPPPSYTAAAGTRKHARLTFRDVHIGRPEIRDADGKVRHLLPHEALLRKLTYSADIQADIHIQVYGPRDISATYGKQKGKRGSSTIFGQHSVPTGEHDMSQYEVLQDELCERVSLGKVPVMVNSSYCHLSQPPEGSSPRDDRCLFDVGGYFIIKGSEKVLVSQEEYAGGFHCGLLKNQKGLEGRFPLSVRKGLFSRPSYVKVQLKYHRVEEKGAAGYQYEVPKVAVQIPFCKNYINAVVLFYALGISPGKELMDIMCIDAESLQLIMPSLRDAEEEVSKLISDSKHGKLMSLKAAALKLIESDSASGILERCFFPDVKSDYKKSIFLGQMISDVFGCCLGRRRLDNKEDLANTRLRVSGSLLYDELKRDMFNACKHVKRSLEKALCKNGNIDLQKHVDTYKLSDGFERAFASGNWAMPAHKMGVQPGGIAVTLDRKNPVAAISHLRQTELQVDARAQLWEARNPSRMHTGRFCVVQSPDGDRCGLVKSLALLGYVTVGSSPDTIIRVLKDYDVMELEAIQSGELKSLSRIILNGQWIASTRTPTLLVEHLRSLRRASKISHEVEIAEDATNRQIRISCDSGRILRPLISLHDQWLSQSQSILDSQRLTAADLLKAGIIEYVGADEEANYLIAADVADLEQGKYFSHCEVHGSFMFGLGASLIPFANHNHASRVMFQSQKVCKQAIGHYTTWLRGRVDKSGQQLLYPQRPLVTTLASQLLNRDELANGQNVVVAVCPYMGYNQEDSIVMNESAIQRGLFTSMHFKCFTTTYNPEKETMMKPTESDDRRSNWKYAAYAKLDVDGLPPVGANLFPEEVVFGKVSSQQTHGFFEDRSVDLKAHERGCVDRVILAEDGNGNIISRVILREKRTPVVGDKFSSVHGQKGVVGLVIPEYELPFTRQGIVPDILINPHSFPSRQTTGQLLETCFGKLAAIRGRRCDGTAYTCRSIDAIIGELHRLGYQRWGEEFMLNGLTGEPMEAKIFIGSTFYQRLTKMVKDQVKFRSRGAKHRFSQQPVDDRQKQGGIRIGEMERDCLLAHGAAINLQERLFLLSDPYELYVCQRCCSRVTRDSRAPIRICKFCKTSKHVVQVGIPYACKLLYEELLSMGVSMHFETELD